MDPGDQYNHSITVQCPVHGPVFHGPESEHRLPSLLDPMLAPTVWEPPNAPATGTFLWPAACLMVDYLLDGHGERIHDRVLLELGAGPWPLIPAVVGWPCLRCGSYAVTDVSAEWLSLSRDRAPWLDVMDRTARFQWYQLDVTWPPRPADPCHPQSADSDPCRDINHANPGHHPCPDLILGSDITFSEELVESLVLHLRFWLTAVGPRDRDGDLDPPRRPSGTTQPLYTSFTATDTHPWPSCVLTFEQRINCDLIGRRVDTMESLLIRLLSEPFWRPNLSQKTASQEDENRGASIPRVWYRFHYRYEHPASVPVRVQGYKRSANLRLLVIWAERTKQG